MSEKLLMESKVGNGKYFAFIISLIGIIMFPIGAEVSYAASDEIGVVLYIMGAVFVILGVIAYLAICKCCISVTDKRIYGATGWGKRVDLPLDSVSAVATGWFGSISVASASGGISFIAIEKRNEIYEVLNKQLIARQNKKSDNNGSEATAVFGNADELKKFKELLDNGAITQEEFNAKKKQLLGL